MPENAKRVYKGVIFDTYQWEVEGYDGSKKIFEKVKRADTVMEIAVTEEGKIILSKQEQPGRSPFIGCLGGRVDEGERPLEAAKRELLFVDFDQFVETAVNLKEMTSFLRKTPIIGLIPQVKF